MCAHADGKGNVVDAINKGRHTILAGGRGQRLKAASCS